MPQLSILGQAHTAIRDVRFVHFSIVGRGCGLAPSRCMKEPSPARQRTLALHARAIQFSTSVNQAFPDGPVNYPSKVVWEQLVRAADSASNNLVEADNGSTDADFLNKMRLALREAKEAKTCLTKIRLAPLVNAPRVTELGLETEADELCAIFATIIRKMEIRLGEQRYAQTKRRP